MGAAFIRRFRLCVEVLSIVHYSARLHVQLNVKLPPSILIFTGAKTIDLRLHPPFPSVNPSHTCIRLNRYQNGQHTTYIGKLK
ncbi:MAG: hypothetical protein ABIM44_09275 [candidate division WOR-3 bacterium]